MKIRHLSQEPLSFDMTSIVDVILLLLIFFMLVATFVPLEAVKVSLPESTQSGEVSPVPELLTITITKDENIYMEGENVPWMELSGKLKEMFNLSDEKKVYIRADKHLNLQSIVKLLDLLREGGVENIHLATLLEE